MQVSYVQASTSRYAGAAETAAGSSIRSSSSRAAAMALRQQQGRQCGGKGSWGRTAASEALQASGQVGVAVKAPAQSASSWLTLADWQAESFRHTPV